MKNRILVSLLALFILGAALQPALTQASALVSINAYFTAKFDDPGDTFIIPSRTVPVTNAIFIALSADPQGFVQVSLERQGDLKLSFPNELVFDSTNYQTRQELDVTYSGGNQDGQTADLILSGSGLNTKKLHFILGTSTLNSGSGASTTGSSGNNTTTNSASNSNTGATSNPGTSSSPTNNGLSLPATIKNQVKSAFSLLPDCLTNDTADASGRTAVQSAGFSCVTDTISHFTNLLLQLVAIAAFLYLLYGAFLYATAFGDENKVKSAKGTITAALIGLVVAVFAIVLVRLVESLLKF